MNFRDFDDIAISEVGLGTWQLGADWGEVADADAQEILDTALENGITFFDTADVYGLGLSETRIREFVQRTGADITIATKLGRFPEPGWPRNFTPETIEEHVDASLKRLGVEALDLTQLHCIPTELLVEHEVFDSLRTIKDSGKIKRFGASVESMEEAHFCLEQEGLSSLQIIFNIYRQKPIKSLFAKAKEKGVALIIRLPLASGMLSGRFDQKTTFAEDDHRHYNKNGEAFNVGETFAGIPFEKGLELTERLKEITPDDIPLSELAMRWILDFEEVSVVIPGATKPEQVVSNAAASSRDPLSAELHQKLADFYENEVAGHIRGAY
ncbi:MAG: aldo/keto reductase [Verrucomicrobiales bacterium]|nr:aldo/keto reductase [Verrucomicrobiales bacterium]